MVIGSLKGRWGSWFNMPGASATLQREICKAPPLRAAVTDRLSRGCVFPAALYFTQASASFITQSRAGA